MSKLRLSHSATRMFQECAKSYQLHYQERYREVKQSANLLFGTAIDKAITHLLTPEDGSKTAEEVFTDTWTFQEVNGVKTYLTTFKDLVYANSDYDEELLLDEDFDRLGEHVEVIFKGERPNKDKCIYIVGDIQKKKEVLGYNFLPEGETRVLNAANWLCLHRKGLIMIESFRKDILKHIKEVYSTQEYVKLENGEGDSIIGYVDLVARYKDIQEPIIFDVKTSARAYDEGAVLTSPQLTLYTHALSEKYNTRKAGFIVFSKQIMKNKKKVCTVCGHDGSGTRFKTCNNEIDKVRCDSEWDIKLDPKAYIQVLIDDIPERTEEIVLDNYEYISQSIKSGAFPRNFNACTKSWGGKCRFYDYCFYGKEDGLIKKEQ